MMDQMGNALRRIVGKDGNNDGPVSIHRQKSDGPAGAIAGAQGNLVPFLHAGSLEKPMILFYLGGQFSVGVSGALIIT